MPASPHAPFPPTLGALLAGGASRRFGAPKALAEVGGRAIAERAISALSAAVERVVVIANEPELFARFGLPTRVDDVAGVGALGGVRTALAWAREERLRGALCVACDMPFVSPPLLCSLVVRAGESGAGAVVPASRGRRGVEPLCAWYSVDALAAVDRSIAEGRTAMVDLLDRLSADVIPLGEVARHGDPDVLFLNVNTADDHRRAMEIAAALASDAIA